MKTKSKINPKKATSGIDIGNLRKMNYGREDPENEDRSLWVETAKVIPESVDLEARTISVVAATGKWVKRWWWVEKLVMTDEAIDQSRLLEGISFLKEHNPNEVHGISTAYRIDEEAEELIIDFEFSPEEDSMRILRDMAGGYRKFLSIAYIIHRQIFTRYEGEDDDRPDEYLVTKWEPYETSTVGVPADEKSQVRSARYQPNQPNADNLSETKAMDPEEEKSNKAGDRSAGGEKQIEVRANQIANDRVGKREKEVDAILTAAVEFDMFEDARRFIAEGKSADEFSQHILTNIKRKQESETPASELGMEDGEVEQYSTFRACRAYVKGGLDGMRREAPLEYEAHVAVANAVGRDANGFFVPTDAQNAFSRKMAQGQKREMLVSSATQGANLVGTDHRGDLFIDVLRDRSLLLQLGAQTITNLRGDVDIPRGDGGVTFNWVGESGTPTESHAAIGMVNLNYKTITGEVQLSRKLMKQSSPSAEAYVINELTQGCALAIDNAGFAGAGGNEILGILNTTGINAVPIAGAYPTWSEVVDFEAAIDADNALIDNMAWVVESGISASWKKNLKWSGVSGAIMENGRCNDYPVYRKTSLAAGTTLLGNYADWVFGMWGVLDLMPDTAGNADSGGLILRVFQDIDGAVRRVSSFAKNTV